MSNWKPTTEQVRGRFTRFSTGVVNVDGQLRRTQEIQEEAFDAWLEDIKAEAWKAGWYAGYTEALGNPHEN